MLSSIFSWLPLLNLRHPATLGIWLDAFVVARANRFYAANVGVYFMESKLIFIKQSRERDDGNISRIRHPRHEEFVNEKHFD